MAQTYRIGEILVRQGVMTEQQVLEVVQAQKRLHLPFGVLAEQMFEVTLRSIEAAWAAQYHEFTGTIDLASCRFDPNALATITRRQAWQFEILPISFDQSGEMVVAASADRLPRAVTFVSGRIQHPTYFRIADPNQLRDHLRRLYPMPEISDELRERMREAV